MADNVNIVYKVDTTEVLKAQALLKQTEAANEALKKSTKDLAASSTTEFAKVGQSINAMKSRMEDLKAAISNGATKNAADLRKYSNEYKLLDAEVKRLTADYFKQDAATKQLRSSTDGLSSEFRNLYQAIQLVISAGVAKEILDTAINMAELAGRIDGVGRAFRSQIPQSTLLLAELQERTHGTITDLQLMQYALKAQNFRIPLEDLGNLLEFAMVRAQQTGESIDYMLNSIITGLGRDSIKILDNLQVDIGAMKKEMDELGISIDEAFGNQVQRELLKMGGFIENSGTVAARLKKEFEELRGVLATRLENSSFLNFLIDSLKGLQVLVKTFPSIDWKNFIPVYGQIKGLNDWRDNLAKLRTEMVANEEAIESMRNFQLQLNGTQEENIQSTKMQIVQNVEMINRNNEQVKGWEKRLKLMDESDQKNQEEIAQGKKAIEHYTFRTEALSKYNEMLNEYLKTLNQEIELEEQKGLIEKLQEDIGKLEDALKLETTEAGIRTINLQLKDMRKELERLTNLGLVFELSPEKVRKFEEELQRSLSNLGITITDVKIDQKSIDDYLKMASERVNMGLIAVVNEKIKKAKEALEAAKTIEDIARINAELKNLEAQLDGMLGRNQKLSLRSLLGDPEVLSGVANTAIDIWQDQLNTMAWMEVQSYEQRLAQLRAFYDEQYILAGDNQKAKDQMRLDEMRKEEEIRRQMAKKEKEARRFSVIIDTAAGIMRAFATSTNIYEGIINAALVALQGASNLAIINKTEPRGFAKGVINVQDPHGKPGQDSIPSMLMPGESVITTESTSKSKKILGMIQAKTLSDDVFDNIQNNLQLTPNGVVYVGPDFDDKNIINAINENSVDYFAVGTTLYEQRKKAEGRKVTIRSRQA